MDVGRQVSTLVEYASAHAMIEAADKTWAYNAVLEAVGATGPAPAFSAWADESFDLSDTLRDLVAEGVAQHVVGGDGQSRQMLAMHIMGLLMPRPSAVTAHFNELLARDPEEATAYLYRLSGDADYVKRSAIERDIKWTAASVWGPLEITINQSKPEKDPLAIAQAARVDESDGVIYPACQLCMENEGYSGRISAAAGGPHPPRQNLRIVPLRLGGQQWGIQYSPYSYYTEHCIVMSEHHVPMHIDSNCFNRLFDFVDIVPHYFIGSNADLPIVGGSILAHDHFQGGRHVFPMDNAPNERGFRMTAYPAVTCGIVRWPLTVLRLRSADRAAIIGAAGHILQVWRHYDDPAVGVVSRSEGLPHNTLTPIVHRHGDEYVMDLALRCNVATPDYPLGVFHPHAELHHIKKENIGLIEVMGLAILPPRLARELSAVAVALLADEDMEQNPLTAPHAAWAADVKRRHCELSEFNVQSILRSEVGLVFAQVLEQAGVFKWDDAGRAALDRFITQL